MFNLKENEIIDFIEGALYGLFMPITTTIKVLRHHYEKKHEQTQKIKQIQ
jgi:hypothetical protein